MKTSERRIMNKVVVTICCLVISLLCSRSNSPLALPACLFPSISLPCSMLPSLRLAFVSFSSWLFSEPLEDPDLFPSHDLFAPTYHLSIGLLNISLCPAPTFHISNWSLCRFLLGFWVNPWRPMNVTLTRNWRRKKCWRYFPLWKLFLS